MKKEATPKWMGLKRKTFDEKRDNLKMQRAEKKDLRGKKRQPQNARGSKERPIKKEATPKCKGLNRKTSDEKRGNPKAQRVQKENLQWKKR
jgi:hypothetical protein